MSNIFKKIPVRRPKLNRFNLSHEVKTTLRMGELIPIFCHDVLPRDIFNVSTEYLVRAMPLIAPVMHRVNVYTYWFFVPNRLIFKTWEQFITGGDDGVSNGAPPPYFCPNNFTEEQARKFFGKGSLFDYLGYPVPTEKQFSEWKHFGGDNSISRMSLLPFIAYQLVYREYFRNENFYVGGESDADFLFDGGYWEPEKLIARGVFDLHYKKWEKDYFTSALPWPQRGPDVLLPMRGEYEVKFKETSTQPAFLRSAAPPHSLLNSNNTVSVQNDHGHLASNSSAAILDPNGSLVADMSDAVSGGPSVVEMRRALKLQQYFEAKARSGSRYTEYLMGIFGQKSSDARLQRPEYLGGGRSPILIDDVIQTSATESSGTPQANLAGRATGVNSMSSFKRKIPEHGWIIGMMAIVPKPSYQNGLPKQFFRHDPLDYYIPQLARIGEQEILNKELYFPYESVATSTEAVQTFGYTPRYADYKYFPSTVHGDLRDNLDFWHLGRRFSEMPHLNGSFITVFPYDGSRIFATQDTGDDQFIVQLYHHVLAKRPMPKYGTPML